VGTTHLRANRAHECLAQRIAPRLEPNRRGRILAVCHGGSVWLVTPEWI